MDNSIKETSVDNNNSLNSAKPDFRKYTDPTGEFSAKEMGWSLWYAKHRVLLYRTLVGALAGWIIIFWGYSLWQWGAYLIFGLQIDKNLNAALGQAQNYTAVHSHFSPQPLVATETNIFISGVNKYDAVAQMTNPNPAFLARFNYYFLVGGVATPIQNSFLLPGESRPVATLGLDGSPAGAAQLVLKDVSWMRVSAHFAVAPATWQAEHLDFSVNNFNFVSASAAGGVSGNIIMFDFTNNSGYHYAGQLFYVGLYNRETLVGVIPLTLASFDSLETKKIDLRSFAPNLQITDVRVFPVINVYDNSVYALQLH